MIHNLDKKANEIHFDKNISGLSANNVQGAIDEVSRTLGYTVTSKNLLPNNNVSHNIGTLEVTVNNNKTITLNGKGASNPWATVHFVGNYITGVLEEINGLEDGVEYIFSCCPSGASGDTYQGHLFINSITEALRDNGEGVKFTHHKGNKYAIGVGVKYNYSVNNVTFQPMIRKASEDSTYEPYVADVHTQIADMDGRILTIKRKTISATSDANGNVYLALIDEYPNLINVRCSSHMTSAIGVIVTQANAYWGCRLVTNSPTYTCLGNTKVTLVITYLE
jgi:hypothetical protein